MFAQRHTESILSDETIENHLVGYKDHPADVIVEDFAEI